MHGFGSLIRKLLNILLIVMLCSLGGKVDSSEPIKDIMQKNIAQLQKAPKVFPCTDVEVLNEQGMFFEGVINTPELKHANSESTVEAIYYQGVNYKGKPTRVFAFMGFPKVPEGTKVPGIVLVHGGGGTAFESWVRLWNARGYAAIAMDTCGCVPIGDYSNWKKTPDGGPMGWGGFDQVDELISDQWTYQAVSAVVLANSLLRSQPQVDSRRIGITGISWGGYLTCITSGLDKRFKFSMPVYGCGFLGDNSAWLPTFKEMGEKGKKWLSMWDPSIYLPYAKMPMLWITGTNDFAYPMDSWQKSYRLPQGPRTLSLLVRMEHGHGGAGENPGEIHAFADSLCLKGKPLVKITKQGRLEDRLWAEFDSPRSVSSAVINYTKDTTDWPLRNWESEPAVISGSKVTAKIPPGAKFGYINILDKRGLIVSTEHIAL